MLHMQAPLLTKVTSYPIYLYNFLKYIYIYIYGQEHILQYIYIYIYVHIYIYMCSACKNAVQDSAHIFTPRNHMFQSSAWLPSNNSAPALARSLLKDGCSR